MDFGQAWAEAVGVESTVSEEEARVLYRLASEAPECVVEIGSWRGRSTIVLAHAVSARDGIVHAIDPFDGTRGYGGTVFRPEVADSLRSNLRRFAPPGSWQFHRIHSQEAAHTWAFPPVSFLWVDGDHTLAGTMIDWRAWVPLLAPGAKVALHDRGMPGPAAVIGEALREGWTCDLFAESLAVLTPPS